MNISTTAPTTIEIKRSRLLGLIGGVAAVAAAVTWAVSSYAVDDGVKATQPSSAQTSAAVVSSPIPVTGYLEAVTGREGKWVRAITSMTPRQLVAAYGTDVEAATVLARLSPQERGYVESIMALTPGQLRAAFGTGLAPSEEARRVQAITSMTPAQLVAAFGTDVRAATVLAGLTPKERGYVESIMALTPAQLRAAFGTG